MEIPPIQPITHLGSSSIQSSQPHSFHGSLLSLPLPQCPNPGVENPIEPAAPHEALFHALAYFSLPELLAIRIVCRSLRDAVDGDVLLWRDVTVEPPLGRKLTDHALLKIAARADGRLESLALIDCTSITDSGLSGVADFNPCITKLYVPGCAGLTPSGILRVAKRLTNLKQLKLYGLLNIEKEHLDSLKSLLHVNPQRPSVFYNVRSSQFGKDNCPIDVDICPKCKDARLVFDCPRERCQKMKDRLLPCSGCFFCIARCEECGGCIDLEELEGTVCLHLLCSECWLQLPKCLLCNLPSCSRHSHLQSGCSNSAGFTCDRCSFYLVTHQTSKWV